jgi:hypothetical protein
MQIVIQYFILKTSNTSTLSNVIHLFGTWDPLDIIIQTQLFT